MRRSGVVERQAAGELLLHLPTVAAAGDRLGAAVGAEEHDLPARRLRAGLLEQRPQAGAAPQPVAHQPVKAAPAVARALEGAGQLGARPPPDLGQRQLQRPRHQTAELQPVAGGVDVRLPVVLDREELAGRGEEVLDGPDVDEANDRRRVGDELAGHVGERDEGFILGQRGHRPIRQAQRRRPHRHRAPRNHLPPRHLAGHRRSPLPADPPSRWGPARSRVIAGRRAQSWTL